MITKEEMMDNLTRSTELRENERMQSLEKLERDGLIEPFVRDYDDD